MEMFRKPEVYEQVSREGCWEIIGSAPVGVNWVDTEWRQGEAGVSLQVSREGDQEGYAVRFVRGDPAAVGQ